MLLTGCRKCVLGGFGVTGVQYNTDVGLNLGGRAGGGLFRTDRAIYLASQLSSMQLFVSKNSGEGKGKVERPLVKH